MSELGDRMELIKTRIATTYAARIVTRDLLDFVLRAEGDLKKGIYTILSCGEGGYKNFNGREAMDGAQQIHIIGQIQLSERAAPSEIEEAEFAMVEEIKVFVRTLPLELCTLLMKGFRQSGQIECPYGWVAIELEFLR